MQTLVVSRGDICKAHSGVCAAKPILIRPIAIAILALCFSRIADFAPARANIFQHLFANHTNTIRIPRILQLVSPNVKGTTFPLVYLAGNTARSKIAVRRDI